MAKTIELTVPDLGGFEDIPVIEVLIEAGDIIVRDAPLVTLESDKATMEVPASAAGTVRQVKVRIGDRVSPGSVLADVEVVDDSAPAVIAADTAPPLELTEPERHPAKTGISSPAEATVDLVVPDLGGYDNVPVISIFVQPGDAIAKDAPLVELESEKATLEVPALRGGVVGDVRVKIGDRVSQGSVIATLAGASSQPTSVTASSPSAAASTPPAPASTPLAPAPVPLAPAPVAHVEPVGVQQRDTLGSPPNGRPAVPSANGSSNGATNGASNGVAHGAPVHASPAIRRFARELGVGLSAVNGHGPNGRITREDVQAFVKRTLGATTAPAAGSGSAAAPAEGGLHLLPWPSVNFERYGPVERTPLLRIAKLTGANLSRNWVLIPHVTQHEDADVTDLEAFRKTVNADHPNVKVTMLALLMKALVKTLQAFPAFNSSLDGDELILKSYYHLGFAADTPAGLVVPVIRDVDAKGVLDIASETAALAKKAREGKLGPGEMSGSSFTVSSLGGIGGTAFTPIVNAPEVAILGLSRTAMKPVWDGAAFAPRLILPLSLSYDHRVIDGAAAARFCVHLAGLLADMRKTLL